MAAVAEKALAVCREIPLLAGNLEPGFEVVGIDIGQGATCRAAGRNRESGKHASGKRRLPTILPLAANETKRFTIRFEIGVLAEEPFGGRGGHPDRFAKPGKVPEWIDIDVPGTAGRKAHEH